MPVGFTCGPGSWLTGLYPVSQRVQSNLPNSFVCWGVVSIVAGVHMLLHKCFSTAWPAVYADRLLCMQLLRGGGGLHSPAYTFSASVTA